MKRGWMWPLGVVAALLFTVSANVVMLVAASSDANGSVVEPEYYRKAVEWDRTLAHRAASERLGWTARVTINPAAPGTLRVLLTDSLGAAVRGADVAVTMIHNRDAANPLRVTLPSTGNGAYEAQLTVPHRGQWEVRVQARRESLRFESSVRVEAP